MRMFAVFTSLQVFFMFALLAGYHHMYSPKVMTLDVNRLIERQVLELNRENLSPEHQKVVLQAFSERLEGYLDFKLAKNAIVLPKEAVIRGGVGTTRELEELIFND